MTRYSDELYHFGVKGMKWGVRKKRSSGRNIVSRGLEANGKFWVRSGFGKAGQKNW